MQKAMTRIFQFIRRCVPMFPQQRQQQLVFTVDFDRESDGRWIAEIEGLPGVMAYGPSQEDALRRVAALAIHVVADRLENGEMIDDMNLGPDNFPSVVFEHQHA